MKKIISAILFLVALVLVIFSKVNQMQNYFVSSDEIFTSSQTATYNNVEFTILNMTYEDNYSIGILRNAEKGYKYLFVEMQISNHSENNFDYSASHWLIKAKKTFFNSYYGTQNPGAFSTYTLNPDESITYTYVFLLPENLKEQKLCYYQNSRNTPSTRDAISDAPSLVITLD